MASPEQGYGGMRRMKANMRVTETVCRTCGGSFSFGEDVRGNPETGSYYHERCPIPAAAYPPPPPQPAPPPAWQMAPQAAPPPPAAAWHEAPQSFPREPAPPPSWQMAPQAAPPEPTATWQHAPQSVPREPPSPPAWQMAPPAAPPEPSATWQNPPPPSPPALPRSAGAGEKHCTRCGEIIRAEAMKCRFCGHILDSALVSSDPPPDVLAAINSNANSALTMGIIGLVICGPVLGSMAISSGNKALHALDNYPLFLGGPRGKAKAGVILGWLDWILLILAVISNAARH